jgi:hypothetical protein
MLLLVELTVFFSFGMIQALNNILFSLHCVLKVAWLKKKKSDLDNELRPTTEVRFNFTLADGSGNSDVPPVITKSTDESYSVRAQVNGEGHLIVDVTAANYFGARHAIETVFQLMEYDEVNNVYIAVSSVDISDAPVFKHRGISLDTSRNFMTVDVIKRMLDGMAASKVSFNLIYVRTSACS